MRSAPLLVALPYISVAFLPRSCEFCGASSDLSCSSPPSKSTSFGWATRRFQVLKRSARRRASAGSAHHQLGEGTQGSARAPWLLEKHRSQPVLLAWMDRPSRLPSPRRCSGVPGRAVLLASFPRFQRTTAAMARKSLRNGARTQD